jgi:hypothetical protein
MKSGLLTSALVVALATAACATGPAPYKKYGVSEGFMAFAGGDSGFGYSDYQVNSDTFFVSYVDALDEPLAEAVAYMNRRASEVCREHGFSGYQLTNTPINGAPGTVSSSVAMQSGPYSVSAGMSGQPSTSSYVKCVR